MSYRLHASSDKKFHHRFVRTLTTIVFDMEAKTDITFGCPFKMAVVNNYKSTENPPFSSSSSPLTQLFFGRDSSQHFW
jgi:hypothetical protein